jgi:hypothetical protein
MSTTHKVEVRAWEKKLQQETSVKSAEKLKLTAQGIEKEYLKNLPKHGKLCMDAKSYLHVLYKYLLRVS